MANKAEILKMLMALMAGFPNFSLKSGVGLDEMTNAYHLVLGDLDGDLLSQVAAHLISTQTFFPAAGEIRRACFHLCELGTGVPTAQDAWAEVAVMIRKGFYYQVEGGWYEVRPPKPEDWSHPIVQKAVDAVGGWVALRTSENTVADRARFLQAYEVYLEREREGAQMLPGVQRMVEQLGAGERTPHKGLPEPAQVRQMITDLAAGMKF